MVERQRRDMQTPDAPVRSARRHGTTVLVVVGAMLPLFPATPAFAAGAAGSPAAAPAAAAPPDGGVAPDGELVESGAPPVPGADLPLPAGPTPPTAATAPAVAVAQQAPPGDDVTGPVIGAGLVTSGPAAGALPETGANTVATSVIAVALGAIGIAMTLSTRRRRPPRGSRPG